MTTEKMTIHEALATLKMLDSRINSKVNGTLFATANKRSNEKIAGKTVEEVALLAEDNYKSVIDMINRRKAIRNALAKSNAETHVVIAGTDYAISEAIEMKKSGMYCYRHLLDTMMTQLRNAQNKVNSENEVLERRADEFVVGIVGNKEKGSADAVAMRQAYVATNSFDLVAMKKLQESIDSLSTMIMTFDAEVDAKISISNATTVIEVTY